MKFKVKTSGTFYSLKRKNKLEKLGFEFIEAGCFQDKPFMITDKEPEIEISNLRELLDFRNRWGAIIIEKGRDTIEIYDAHRE